MQPKDLNITVENGIKTLEVLTGAALEPKEPQQVVIFGTLDAPLKWLEKRITEIEQKKAFVAVDREEMSIQLVIDENNHYRTEIKGQLQLHPVFLKFGINQGQYRTPIEMSEFIKMNRSYFDNKQAAMELVSLLRNFRAKVNKDVEAEVDCAKGTNGCFSHRKSRATCRKRSQSKCRYSRAASLLKSNVRPTSIQMI